MGLKEEIFAAPAEEERELVTAWGKEMQVGCMSAADMVAISDGKTETGAFVGKVLVRSLFDGEGNLIFTDEDLPQLMKKGHKTIKRLFDAAARVNGIDEKALAKN